MSVKLLTEHHLECLSLKGGSSESTLVKMPHCWKSHVADHIINPLILMLEMSTAQSYSTRITSQHQFPLGNVCSSDTFSNETVTRRILKQEMDLT